MVPDHDSVPRQTKTQILQWREPKVAAQKKRVYNAVAHRAANHLNTQIANNESDTQQYMFANIAYDIGASTDDVRSALSNGGYNGVTFMGISAEERTALARYGREGS
ncbi:hypothetical protein BwSH20_73920 [Bradyrhizobium ottawaense]|nr:hypothetical protein BwSH20_73920 [Bradyrhizobium ottawaense]GMO76433.1 hypothetical protein BwSG10_42630 [Bradyrhizobium ottawaense]GMP03622.1 hypothetical protein BwDG23_42630 [Bradyrhizobium ottawaense]GMP21537.1 hypothetical protein BwSH12_75470 [Bradyrhizobium ottawaense]